MIVARIFLSSGLLFAAASSSGFESDVHFGLTQWLALQAGFDEESAKTIAIGDQRVESGDMQYVGPVLAYACVAKEDLRSKLAGEHHYPSAGALPGAPETRTVARQLRCREGGAEGGSGRHQGARRPGQLHAVQTRRGTA